MKLCIVHLVRASLNYGSRDGADSFAAEWNATHPAISQIWRRNWAQVTPFFVFPADIRKVIYTTDAVELRVCFSKPSPSQINFLPFDWATVRQNGSD